MNTKTLAILLSDTYKQVHNKMLPPGLTKLVSYWTPRKSMLKYQKRMVFFGLQAFVQEYLIEYFNTWFFKLPESLIASTYISTMNIQLTSNDTGYIGH